MCNSFGMLCTKSRVGPAGCGGAVHSEGGAAECDSGPAVLRARGARLRAGSAARALRDERAALR